MVEVDVEETVRFTREELADVMRRVAEREAPAAGPGEGTGLTELTMEDVEPLDSETASFSLEAPPLKSLEARDATMPHAAMPHVVQTKPAAEPAFIPELRLSAGIGAGLALLCAGALWALGV